MNSLRKLAVYGGICLSIFFFFAPQPIAFAQGIDRVIERQESIATDFFSAAVTVFDATTASLTSVENAYKQRATSGTEKFEGELASVAKAQQAVTTAKALYTKTFNDLRATGVSPTQAQVRAVTAADVSFRNANVSSGAPADITGITNAFLLKLTGPNSLVRAAETLEREGNNVGANDLSRLTSATPITTAGTEAAQRIANPDKCQIWQFSLVSCVDVFVAYIIKNTLLQFAGFLLWLSTNLLNYIVIYGILQFGTWAPDAFYPLWQLIRQIISMFVVFSGLYLGFMYIINKQDTFKKYLPWVVVFALFVNFSYPLTRAAIDVSNIISLNIYASAVNDTKTNVLSDQNINNSAGAILMGQLGLQGLVLAATYTAEQKDAEGKPISILSSIDTWPAALLVVGYVLYAAYIFLMASGILMMRTLALSFIIIFSPLLLVDVMIPKLGERAQQLRGIFFSQLAVSVVFMVMLYLSIQMTLIFGQGGAVTRNAVGSVGNLSNVSQIANVLMMLIMLHIMLKVTKEVSGAVGEFATKGVGMVGGFAGGIAMGGAGLLARSTLGAGAARLARSGTVDRMQNTWVGNRVKDSLLSLQNSSFDARNTDIVQKNAGKIGFTSMGKGLKTYDQAFKDRAEKTKARADGIQDDATRAKYIDKVKRGVLGGVEDRLRASTNPTVSEYANRYANVRDSVKNKYGLKTDGDLIAEQLGSRERERQDTRNAKVASYAEADQKARTKLIEEAGDDYVLKEKYKAADQYTATPVARDQSGNLTQDTVQKKVASLMKLDNSDMALELINKDSFKEVAEDQKKELEKLEGELELMARTTDEEKKAYDQARRNIASKKQQNVETLKKLRSDLRSAYNVATTGRDLKSNLDLQEGKIDVDLTQEAELPFKLETNTQANARVQTQNFINEAVDAARQTAYTKQDEQDKHTIDFNLDVNVKPKVTLNIESDDRADARVASYSQQVNTPQDIHDFVKMAMQGGKRA